MDPALEELPASVERRTDRHNQISRQTLISTQAYKMYKENSLGLPCPLPPLSESKALAGRGQGPGGLGVCLGIGLYLGLNPSSTPS